MKTRLALATSICAILLRLDGGLAWAAEPAPAVPGVARAAGACRADQICTLRNPEDIADLAGTPWLLVAQQDPAAAAMGMVALDSRTRRLSPVRVEPGAPSCIPDAQGGGLGLRREAGGYRLIRIVHQGHYAEAALDPARTDAVETYRVTVGADGPVMKRVACVIAPPLYFLNDVAALANGGFVATHMFDRSDAPAIRSERFLAGQPTGFVVRWSPGKGWSKIPGSDGVFPNGIDASQDGRWIAYAETYGHRVTLIRPDGSGRRPIALAMNPDNVVWSVGRTFIVAGGTGVPLRSTAGCAAYRLQGCAFPAAAARVDFATGSATSLVSSGGAELPGFSVAAEKNGSLYVGSATGDRLTILDLARGPVAIP